MSVQLQSREEEKKLIRTEVKFFNSIKLRRVISSGFLRYTIFCICHRSSLVWMYGDIDMKTFIMRPNFASVVEV